MSARTLRKSDRYTGYLQYYFSTHLNDIVEARAAGRLPTQMAFCRHNPGDYSSPQTSDLTFVLNAANDVSGEFNFTERKPFRDIFRTGGFAVLPPDISPLILPENSHQIYILSTPYSLLRDFVGEEVNLPDHGDFGPILENFNYSSEIKFLILRLWQELRGGSPYGALASDGLTLQLIASLLRISGRNRDNKASQLRMSPAAMTRVLDYIESSLDKRFEVADLASAAGLSSWHFSRCFKAETGISPAAYAVQRRLEKAKELLSASKLSVTDIAHQCGFSSSQHLATVFRRHVGTTPSHYRQTVGS